MRVSLGVAFPRRDEFSRWHVAEWTVQAFMIIFISPVGEDDLCFEE